MSATKAMIQAQLSDTEFRLSIAQASLVALKEHHLAWEHIPDGPADCLKCEVISSGFGEAL